MAKQPILVVAREIHGGTQKDPHITRAGTRLDAAEQKALGLSDKDVERYARDGVVVVEDAYVGDSALPAGQTAPGTTGTAFEGLSIDDMRKTLDEAKVGYPKGASAPDLMKIALEHQAEPAKAEPAKTEAAKA